ncbi:ribose ABC transporter, ATP-binding protein [Clostridium sp. D5]|nr:ribose ABC transporter, ATP-binding protein [Clostridium sp. D5]
MENIKKTFPGVAALQNFSLEVNRGEVHALVGENGAGKSTLIKILYGVYQPNEGNIYIDGEKVTITNASEAMKHGIGVVFQELSVCPHLDVANNIFLGRVKNICGITDDNYIVEEARKILQDVVHLDIDPTALVKYLSIAERQMIEISRVVSQGCRIVVFDEPTSSLTDIEIRHLFEIIRDLKKRGVGIVYISHRMEELDELADCVTVMRDGQLVQSMNYKDTDIDTIIKLMVGRDMNDIYPKYKRKIGEVIFEANNIRYKDKLDVGHLEVHAGEILGIAGLVGSGRTETMRAIFGVDPVDTKQVFICGKECSMKNPESAIESGFVYMTEDRKANGVALGLDIQDNITMASYKKFSKKGVMNDKSIRDNAKEFVEKLQIKTPNLQQKVGNLSGGNQQKVIIAKWLTRRAKVIVFDEPTRGIDVGAKYEIYNIMNELSDQGLAIIMISSDLPEVLGMSDRVVVFRNGRVAGELDISEADSEKIMRHATGFEEMDSEES